MSVCFSNLYFSFISCLCSLFSFLKHSPRSECARVTVQLRPAFARYSLSARTGPGTSVDWERAEGIRTSEGPSRADRAGAREPLVSIPRSLSPFLPGSLSIPLTHSLTFTLTSFLFLLLSLFWLCALLHVPRLHPVFWKIFEEEIAPDTRRHSPTLGDVQRNSPTPGDTHHLFTDKKI